MPDRTDLTALIVAGSCLAGGILLGLALRWLFGRLLSHSAGTAMAWDDLGWRLLRSLSLPGAIAAGIWGAAEALQLRDPVRPLVDKALLVGVVLAATLAVAGITAAAVRSVATARSGVDQSASIFVNITRIVVLVIGLLVVLGSLGISITPMLTALGVGGLAVALALQEPLANLFAGVQVLASKKVQPGDYIKLDSGEDGYVVDITWRNTTIRQLTGNIVVIPNSRVAGSNVTNFYQPLVDMSVLVQVGVSYDSDLEQVERVTIEVATDVMTTVEGGVPGFEPFIRYHTFGDSSINFTVILRVAEYVGQYLVVHEFIKRLHARYRAEGIEIPFPIRTVVMPDRDKPDGRVGSRRSSPPAARVAGDDQA